MRHATTPVTADAHYVPTPEERNREMQLQAAERAAARRDSAIDAYEAEQRELDRQLRAVGARFENWCGTLRGAAAGCPSALAYVGKLIASATSDFGTARISGGLDAMNALADKLERDLPGVRDAIGSMVSAAREQERAANRAAFLMAVDTEAHKLGPTGTIHEIEKHGARLELIKGRIYLRGAVPDERTKLLIEAHRAEICQILAQRAEIYPAE